MKEFQGRLLALDTSFGITNVQTRSYLPGRLWLATNQPETLHKALYQCNIHRKPRRIWANEGCAYELDALKWKPETLPKAGQWVRAARGLYKGDLAFVLKHTAATDILQIAIVPRIAPSPLSQPSGKKRKSSSWRSRLAPSLFDPTIAQAESFREEQDKIAAAQERLSKDDGESSAQGAGRNQIVVAKVLNAVEKLDRPTPPDGPNLYSIKTRTFPDGIHRSPHEGKIPQDICYRYKRATFIGGLLIKSIHGLDYRLKFSPLKDEIIPFVNSRVWPAVILPQFVALSWQEGDKVLFYDGLRETLGTIASIGSATGGLRSQEALVRLEFDAEGGENTTGLCISTRITELQRRWKVGDGVRAIAGPETGRHGLIVEVSDDPSCAKFLERNAIIPVRWSPRMRDFKMVKCYF